MIKVLIFSIFLRFCTAFRITFPPELTGIYPHVDAHFGPRLDSLSDTQKILTLVQPDRFGCKQINKLNHSLFSNDTNIEIVALILRGSKNANGIPCTFSDKILNAQKAGFTAVVVGNNIGGYWIHTMFADNKESVKITIPSVSISQNTYSGLFEYLIKTNKTIKVELTEEGVVTNKHPKMSFYEKMLYIMLLLFLFFSATTMFILGGRLLYKKVRTFCDRRNRALRLQSIPLIQYNNPNIDSDTNDTIVENEEMDVGLDICLDDRSDGIAEIQSKHKNIDKNSNDFVHNDTCGICLEDFSQGEIIKRLPCKHGFHQECVDGWLVKAGKCPICVQTVF